MDFDFDPIKSDRILAERGFDFAYATRVFEGRVVSFIDDRRGYGEVRMVAIGEIDGRLFTVVYTDREGIRRIISAHRASRQESRTWRQSE
ncbi:BrnT family toxin [Beijerinckia sp. L45]|uniref:BrnT family toxin n=1 Tax=Beijerinckia sp. L45 TaxID=1641855 RepID=UPI00131AF8E8|nr:BrnT family toxin [Beijerinckia sp. L45]